MLKFYASIRPIYLGSQLLMPELESLFKGLDVKMQNIAENRNVDGRMLFQMTIGEDSQYSGEHETELKAIVLEGLQAWGVHEKSLESALELAESLTEVEWQIDGSEIEVVSPKGDA